MRGLVMKSTGSWYTVLGDDNQTYASRVRGKIRLDGIKETNPVAVGDYVELTVNGNEASIEKILPRENYVVRQSVKKTGHTHVIAANIDQALLVVTLAFPRTSLGFIDRFLVAAESFRIPQVLVFNKSDLLDGESLAAVNALIGLYRSINVTCFLTSGLHAEQEELRSILKGKKTLVAGHSGVGKSTLLNRLSPGIMQAVGDVSAFTEKGTHTTTFAEMFRLNEDTFIIDTPGIKELGLVDMSPEEVSDYFPEMRELRNECKFSARCLHLNEPKCAVLKALEAGQIAPSRYESYVSMVRGEDNRR
ncbi:MAG: ribosome small subunit-dependent GTPase A [Bacteroidota bacterium]